MNTQKKFTRAEIDAMARERKIPYYYDLPIHELRVKLDTEKPIVKLPTGNYSKGELNAMARNRGIRGYSRLSKYDLAEKLDIVLSKPRPKQRSDKPSRRARPVEVLNPDGTTTTYPSISKAAKAMEVLAMQLYTMAANGEVQIN